jgi:hypothetical protein
VLQFIENKMHRKAFEPKKDKVSDKLEPYVPKGFVSYIWLLMRSRSVGVQLNLTRR